MPAVPEQHLGSRAAATRRAPPAPVRVTAWDGSVTHYVTDVQMGASALDKAPQALCGQTFVPAGLTVPPGPLCALCVAVKAALRTAPPADGHR